MRKSSRFEGFYKLSINDRINYVKEFANLSDEEVEMLKKASLSLEEADKMIENVIGIFPLPLGVAMNFLINGRDYIVPMAIEEPSVVAAASHAAKIARVKGGFLANADESIMIGQIQFVNVKNIFEAKMKILEKKEELIKIANEIKPSLIKRGGGVRDLNIRVLDTRRGKMLIVHVLINVVDAMGANIVNTICEKLAPYIQDIIDGEYRLRIVSNLAIYRLARAYAVFDKEAVGGEEIVDGILDAYEFARNDIFRAVTHNKGILNGIIAVATATGQDTRAIESACHGYAAMNDYKPLTHYEKDEQGNLIGYIEVPLSVGTVGGATRSNPVARICLKILGVKTAKELAAVMAAVGLAQNFAALRALVKEGIQRGHMKLHARQIALSVGCPLHILDKVVEEMIKNNNFSYDFAKMLVERYKKEE